MGCWLYTPGAVHGELGPRGGEGVGGAAWHWLEWAVWTQPMAWAVVLEACGCRLVRTCLRQNGALQVLDR
jgi:hypothetical protein